VDVNMLKLRASLAIAPSRSAWVVALLSMLVAPVEAQLKSAVAGNNTERWNALGLEPALCGQATIWNLSVSS
jgi:hypothetical protein